MTRLIWSRPAEADLLTIASYYREIDDAVAETMLLRIEHAPLILLDHPRLGAPTNRPSIRKWRVPRTPFGLLYALVTDGVEIRRVVHLASNWRGRT